MPKIVMVIVLLFYLSMNCKVTIKMIMLYSNKLPYYLIK